MSSRGVSTVVCSSIMLLAVRLVAASPASWSGLLRGGDNNPLSGATITMRSASGNYSATTSASGGFAFSNIVPGSYEVSVVANGTTYKSQTSVVIGDRASLASTLQLSPQDNTVHLAQETQTHEASGGEHLSSGEVSSLPLNSRDFSK